MEALLRSVDRTYIRHIPDRDDVDPLYAGHSAFAADNRWNIEGRDALYLAIDAAVAVGEWSRHLEVRAAPPRVNNVLKRRRLWAIHCRVDRVVDLTNNATCEALGIDDPPFSFARDLRFCQRIAERLYAEGTIQGIIVPSMSRLDDTSLHNLVLFAANIPDYPGPAVTTKRRLGHLPDPSELLS